jgi:hypothetical protein
MTKTSRAKNIYTELANDVKLAAEIQGHTAILIKRAKGRDRASSRRAFCILQYLLRHLGLIPLGDHVRFFKISMTSLPLRLARTERGSTVHHFNHEPLHVFRSKHEREEEKVLARIVSDLAENNLAINLVEKIVTIVFTFLLLSISQFLKFRFLRI